MEIGDKVIRGAHDLTVLEVSYFFMTARHGELVHVEWPGGMSYIKTESLILVGEKNANV